MVGLQKHSTQNAHIGKKRRHSHEIDPTQRAPSHLWQYKTAKDIVPPNSMYQISSSVSPWRRHESYSTQQDNLNAMTYNHFSRPTYQIDKATNLSTWRPDEGRGFTRTKSPTTDLNCLGNPSVSHYYENKRFHEGARSRHISNELKSIDNRYQQPKKRFYSSVSNPNTHYKRSPQEQDIISATTIPKKYEADSSRINVNLFPSNTVSTEIVNDRQRASRSQVTSTFFNREAGRSSYEYGSSMMQSGNGEN